MDGSDSYELAQADQLVMAAGTYSHPDRGTPFDELSRESPARQRTHRRPEEPQRQHERRTLI